jgi:hypothetical protein
MISLLVARFTELVQERVFLFILRSSATKKNRDSPPQHPRYLSDMLADTSQAGIAGLRVN